MLKPDPTGSRGSNSVRPDSWPRGPELEDRFESHHLDHGTGLAIDPADPELVTREIFMAAGQQDFGDRRRDYRTSALTAAIIALSLLLGWMVGRAGWSMAVHRAEIQSPDVSDILATAAEVDPDPLPASPNAEASIDGTQSTHSSPPAITSNQVPKSKGQAAEPNGGLMMFEHGKPVFRAAPSEKKPQTEGARDLDSQTASDQVPRPATNSYLLRRVVPKYPEQAKQQHIQGPVVLNAVVKTDGSVQEVKVVSGEPELVAAAVEAVKQWRFQPQRVKGNPVEFETQITVNFSLP
jgi:TonB family protein